MFKFINCLFNCGVVLQSDVVSLMAGRPLVYRCFLGMVDTKGQQRKSITPRHRLLHDNVNIRNTCLVHQGPQVLHEQGCRVLHENAAPSYYTKAPKYYSALT
jgi:hypothetical protein